MNDWLTNNALDNTFLLLIEKSKYVFDFVFMSVMFHNSFWLQGEKKKVSILIVAKI